MALLLRKNRDYFNPSQDPSIKNDIPLIDAAHTFKAIHELHDGLTDAAINDLKFALDRFPNHPLCLQLLGSVAISTKKFLLPMSYYKKALELFPQHALTHAQYGSYLTKIGHLDAGIQKLKQAIKMESKLTVAYVWLAQAYFKKGNMKIAQQTAEEAKRLGYKGEILAGVQE